MLCSAMMTLLLLLVLVHVKQKLLLMIMLLLFMISSNNKLGGLSQEQHLVEYLPGFPDKLPFKLETGYIGVGDKEEVQLFYYFFESESNNPDTDPLMLWFTGGPACSGLSELAFEVGPFTMDAENYKRGAPALKLNKQSWTKVANIIFIDQPVGTGFSYANSTEANYTNDTLSAKLAYEFLAKWLISHPEFQENPLYISGTSYAGIMVPLVVNEIYNGIEAGSKPKMNIKGYILGNPFTDSYADMNGRLEYAYRMGLLSDRLYQSTKVNCRGNYISVDPENASCLEDLERVHQCLDEICKYYILDPSCDDVVNEKRGVLSRRTLSSEEMPTTYIESVVPTTKLSSQDYLFPFLRQWANDKFVQKALHIREGTITEWSRCNHSIQNTEILPDGTTSYTRNVLSTVNYHKDFTNKNCRALIYSGDHDLVVPHTSTEKWIDTISPIQSDWRPWFVEGQIAGYTMMYGNGDYQLTYATVKGAGHTASDNKPYECFAMITRWFAQSSL